MPAEAGSSLSHSHSLDRNGRRYTVCRADGRVMIDDVNATRPLPPPPDLPPLSAPPSCGLDHCVAVEKSLGAAISWATSKAAARFGQLGWPAGDAPTRSGDESVPLYTPRRIVLPSRPDEKIVDATAGDAHTGLVDASGGLWLCGSDRWTQLGQDRFWAKGHIWQREPRQVPSLAQNNVRVKATALGADHSLALDEDGRVWAFGYGQHGQLFGESRRPFTSAPAVSAALSSTPSGGDGVTKIWARGNCSCALGRAAGLGWKCIGRCENVQREALQRDAHPQGHQ